MTPLDPAWLAAHPLPDHPPGTDKNSRGRVLLAGGSALVPGAVRLTGEAALRAGAGKLRIATLADAVTMLGLLIPEAAVMALPADDQGEIAASAADALIEALDGCDAFLLGPGMGARDCAGALVARVLAHPRDDLSIVLDAAAIACAADDPALMRAHGGRLILTPHHGEMAALTGMELDAIAADPETAACEAARRYGAILVLKSGETIIAHPDGRTLHWAGGGVGLATGGSGDVLAGLAAALLARGAQPLTAAAWAVWLHGEAGKALAERLGPIGFLARELLDEVPRLMGGL